MSKRRLNKRPPGMPRALWEKQMQKFHAEACEGSSGGPRFEAALMRPASLAYWLVSGDPKALMFSLAFSRLCGNINRGALPLCLACDYEFLPDTVPGACFVLMPFRPDVQNVVLSPICSKCSAQTDDQLWAVVAKTQRALWGDDLRIVQITPTEGSVS